MAGLHAQLGWALEPIPGQVTAPSRFVPFVSESLGQEIERDEVDTLVAANRVLRSDQWSPGECTVGGDVGFELYPSGVGQLLQLMFGSVATSSVAVGRWSHRFTPGPLSGLSATFQVGRPTTDGTVVPFTYAGCKVASWELAVAAGEYATLGLTLAAISESTNTPLQAAVTPVVRPLLGSDTRLTIDGATVAVRALRLAGNNALDTDRRPVAADCSTIREPLEAGLRAYTGTLAGVEFRDLDLYQRFADGTEAALTLALAAGGDTVDVTANVRFDGTTPHVEDRGLLAHDLPVTILAPGSDDGDAIAVTLTNSDPTP